MRDIELIVDSCLRPKEADAESIRKQKDIYKNNTFNRLNSPGVSDDENQEVDEEGRGIEDY